MNDHHTPIHNEVLEALAKINLSPYETRVLFVIWRKTYGFIDKTTGLRKKIDWIAGSQISEMTGLDRRHVSRALKGLKEKHVISRDDNKTGFSKEFMKLMSSVEMTKEEMSSVETPPVEMTPTPSRDDKLSSVEGHTKETKEIYTKETIPKGIAKSSYGNQDINFLISYLKEKLNLPILDETEQMNRRYCYLALKKFGGLDKMKLLIETTATNTFWATKITSFKSLYYKGVMIISSNRDYKSSTLKL